ncbi:MAG: ATP-binding protein [Polyangiaceae bacterium]
MTDDATFRGLVEAAPDGIVISRNGVVLYVNAAAVRLLGYDEASELVGQPMSIFLDGPAMGAMRARLEHMRRVGAKLAPHEYPAKRRDGSVVVAEIASMFIEHEGAPAVLAFARDVTERVEMRAQLAHAERLAAIGVLAAGVAHEINNPLAYMSLSAELILQQLARRGEPQQMLDDVRAILTGTQRIARIVRELRTYARQDDEPVGRVDLAEVLASAERVVAHELKPRARVRREIGELPTVLGTDTRLEQVFVNLLLNAAHAIPDDRSDGEVGIRARAGERDVAVEVSDNGVGIPAEALPRIFEPFFTTKAAGAGTGLGLSISRDIVTSLGGELVAASEVGRGTTMRVTLPRAPERATARDASLPPRGDGTVERHRVLVIDDEKFIVDLVTEALRGKHDVVGTTDPHHALEQLVDGGPFDVIVCDLMMSSLTGMDLHASAARARPGLEGRFVFATGGPTTDRARAFLATVPNARLTKPFSVKELEECVMAVARGGRAG